MRQYKYLPSLILAGLLLGHPARSFANDNFARPMNPAPKEDSRSSWRIKAMSLNLSTSPMLITVIREASLIQTPVK